MGAYHLELKHLRWGAFELYSNFTCLQFTQRFVAPRPSSRCTHRSGACSRCDIAAGRSSGSPRCGKDAIRRLPEQSNGNRPRAGQPRTWQRYWGSTHSWGYSNTPRAPKPEQANRQRSAVRSIKLVKYIYAKLYRRVFRSHQLHFRSLQFLEDHLSNWIAIPRYSRLL